MSQGNTFSPNTGTVTGLQLTNNYNAGLQALQSENSGNTAPANDISVAPVFGQRWMDTSVGGKGKMKLFDGTSWLTWGILDTVNHVWQPQIGGGQFANLASAATTDLGSVDASVVTITGTTTITSFGSSAPIGSLKVVRFNGALTLTHGANLICPNGGSNILTANADRAIVYYIGSGQWEITAYQRNSGAAIFASLSTIPFSAGMHNGTLVATVAANALTIAIKTLAGADPTAGDPVLLTFRNPTAATGDYTLITLTSALSITVPSAATLGTVSAQANRIWVGVFNNAGTPVLAVYNSLNSTGPNVACWDESNPQSGTAIGAGSTSSQVWYSASAISTKGLRILGYVEAQQATAGTWASSPTKIQLYGPGINKPGSIVQELSGVTATAGTTTSATFAALTTGQTIVITPQSAPNIIRVETFGSAGGGGSGTGAIQLSRGTTNNTNMIGNVSQMQAAVTGAAAIAYDVANTISSLTYAVQGKSSSGTLTYGGAGLQTIMSAKEIQI